MRELPVGFLLEDTRGMTLEQIAENANRTFEGYAIPINHNPDGFAAFCRTHHLDLAQSIVLRNEHGNCIGQTMLAIRGLRGWCGGFGIVPAYRGQGFAGLLINALIERARQSGLSTLSLEVLQENEPALRAYQRAGFEVIRPVVSFSGNAAEVRARAISEVEAISISVYEALSWFAREEANSIAPPVWQRELCMLFTKSDLHALTAETDDADAVLVYGFHRPSGVMRIERFAFSSLVAAYAVLVRAIDECEGWLRETEALKPLQLFVLNEPENTVLYALLNDLNLPVSFKQYEMSLSLNT